MLQIFSVNPTISETKGSRRVHSLVYGRGDIYLGQGYMQSKFG